MYDPHPVRAHSDRSERTWKQVAGEWSLPGQGHAMDEGITIQLRKGLELTVNHQPGVAPPFIFLHGGLGNRLNWRSHFAFAVAQG
jgi:pimeloyl-ACP methyl ester carboxylesterase